MAESRRVIDIAPAAIAKVIAAVVLVWLWLQLWPLLMVIVIATVVAIGLDPTITWLEQRRLPRGLAAAGLVVLLAVLVVGFFWVAGSSLVGQAHELGGRLSEVQVRVTKSLPKWLARGLSKSGPGVPDASVMAGYVYDTGRLVIGGAIVAVLALILTVYLLTEGRQTYAWLAAYAPPAYRARVHATALEAQKAIFGYVSGNATTSILATVFVFTILSLLRVPAALLLAILAGVFDFVPVLGFICSSVPAVVLALSVSPTIALIVAGLYVAYHLAENYYIGPKVYGNRLRLSNFAVIVAFAVGAEIGGIGGAVLALPLAALYPVIESVWLKDYLGRAAIEDHRRIERQNASDSPS